MLIEFRKERVKVFIILDTNNTGITTTVNKDYEGAPFYSGFTWEIWKQIESRLKDKYDFIVTFSKDGENNYPQFVKDVYNNKYDIVIGDFNHNSKREKLVNFSYPFMIDANTVLYRKTEDIWYNLKSVIFSSNFKLLIFLLLTGCIFGILLYFFDPNRVKNLNISFENHKKYLLRSILTGISTMLGEMGYLSENSSLSFLGIVIVIIIMVVAYVFALFFQANITKTLIQQQQKFLNKDNIKNKRLIGIKGHDSVKKMERYTNTVKVFENKTIEEMVDMFLKNEDKYDGLVLSYCEGLSYIKKNTNLNMTLNFGFEPQSFIVNQKKQTLLKDVNIIISRLRFTLKLQRMCHTYFDNIDGLPICKL
jgi:ABC-type amino acid transport substrate-binding protein